MNSCANRTEGVASITLVRIVSNPSLPARCCLEIDIKDLKYAQKKLEFRNLNQKHC
jgi:hypothetical protein